MNQPTAAAVHGCDAPLDPQQAQVMLDLADENATLVRQRDGWEEDARMNLCNAEYWRVCYWKEHRAKHVMVLCWTIIVCLVIVKVILTCNAEISGEGASDE